MTKAHLGRVLVVDNDPHFRRSVQVLLDAAGYTVSAAGTQAEAKQIATREKVHVAVLDIRMKSDPDHDDMSGLDLAEQLDPLIVKIMLSAYPSVATVRSSFGDASAFAFVDKEEGPDKLLEELARAFEERVRIKFDLCIRWQDMGLQEVADGIEVEGKPDPDVLEAELEEVLRKLFFEAEEIRVAPLIPAGQAHLTLSGSGAALLKVQPCYHGSGWGAPVVVKVATREKTAAEGQNYDQYVEGFIAGFRHTRLYRRVQTHLLGGIIYTLVGTPLDECMDLGTFYAERPTDETIEVLKRLFGEGCCHWYANREDKTTLDLVELYGRPLKLSPERLESALHEAGLSDWIGGGEARHKVPGLRLTVVNPIQWLRSHPSLRAQASLCYTHGDMHSRNVLVDQNRHAWLIDFFRTGPGHLFRDLIELESDIKFVLLNVTDLPSLLRLEAALLSASDFGDRPTLPRFKDPDLGKAFFVVLALRQIASELAPEANMLDYYQGLLLHTLAMIRFRHVPPAKKRHAYLAASLLCQRLDEW